MDWFIWLGQSIETCSVSNSFLPASKIVIFYFNEFLQFFGGIPLLILMKSWRRILSSSTILFTYSLGLSLSTSKTYHSKGFLWSKTIWAYIFKSLTCFYFCFKLLWFSLIPFSSYLILPIYFFCYSSINTPYFLLFSSWIFLSSAILSCRLTIFKDLS